MKKNYKTFDEFTRPSKIQITFLDGRKYDIKPKRSFRDKAYQQLLLIFDEAEGPNANPKFVKMANKIVDKLQSK